MIQRVHKKKEVRIEELKIEATSDYRSRASSVSTGSDLASDSDYAVDYGRPRLFPPAKADYIRTKRYIDVFINCVLTSLELWSFSPAMAKFEEG